MWIELPWPENPANTYTRHTEAQGSTLFAFPTASHHQRVSKTSAGSGFPYHILSATSLDSNSSGGPEGPFGLVWLSLPLLVYNSVRSLTVHFLCRPSYILVQRPLNRPLNLWNDMFGCHQAEITVMQFRGHSLPVRQSMSVSWLLPCPISSANFRLRDFLS